jgi:hypothetical protein
MCGDANASLGRSRAGKPQSLFATTVGMQARKSQGQSQSQRLDQRDEGEENVDVGKLEGEGFEDVKA